MNPSSPGPDAPVHPFDADTAVAAIGDGRWSAAMTDRWDTPNGPNGGYSLATVVRALGAALPHPDPFVLSATYLRPVGHGDAGPDRESAPARGWAHVHVAVTRARDRSPAQRKGARQRGGEVGARRRDAAEEGVLQAGMQGWLRGLRSAVRRVPMRSGRGRRTARHTGRRPHVAAGSG